MPRHKVLDLIRTLDPVDDHQQIVYLMTAHEFPVDITRALEFALYRTFAVPSISALPDRTGEFTRHAQKRYDDTDYGSGEYGVGRRSVLWMRATICPSSSLLSRAASHSGSLANAFQTCSRWARLS